MEQNRQTILILGMAREGLSLARYFLARDAHVIITDVAQVDGPWAVGSEPWEPGREPEVIAGGHHPELVARSDRIFVSPGVPESNPVYAAALARGLRIESMTTLFFELCPAPIVGITGSSGKTTTTSLIGHILAAANQDVLVGGNIGDPMLDLLPAASPGSTVLLELSSFQLAILRRSPHIAVVTNISPNHLDRHGTIEAYVAAKRNIVEHQAGSDYVVLNAADRAAIEFAEYTPADRSWFALEVHSGHGAGVRDGVAGLLRDGTFTPVIDVNEVPLLGRHNIENVLAALAVTSILGVSVADMAAAVRSYRPPAHRLELVGERGGVRYIDDSIATSPSRAAVALQAIEAPVVLIAGGRHKNLPWDEFAELVCRRARALLLIGEATDDIDRAVRQQLNGSASLRPSSIVHCSSLRSAVVRASRLAQPGDVVLLSPACTSYDMFRDFEERGRDFVRAVESLDAA